MKKIFYIFPLLITVLSFSISSFAQVRLQEGFETTDTIPGIVPAGWSVWNNTVFQIDSTSNWMVRDSARYMPGLSTDLSKSHTSKRAMGVTWWTGTDSSHTNFHTSDAWLVSKRFQVLAGDSLRFFVSGGRAGYADSMQVWVSIIDSIPANFLIFPQYKLGSIYFPRTSTYGQFIRKAYSLNIVAGQRAWIGFRYYMDCTADGFAVYLDDILVSSPLVGVQQNSEIPKKFALEQNYPNPFNPETNIKFDLPKAGNVQLIVYNSMGQEIKTLMNEYKIAGSYNVNLNASGFASGIYFYKIITSDFTEIKKMTLVK